MMKDPYHCGMDAGSWPTALGNSWNSRVSSSTATARGKSLWSVPLPGRAAGGITVTADGQVFVTSGNHLTAVKDGRIKWSVQIRALGSPVALTQGRLITNEIGSLTIRDQATGTCIASFPAGGLGTPAITSEEHIVYIHCSKTDNPRLLRIDMSGEVVWSRQLSQRSTYPPLLVMDLIVVGDGSYCRAYDRDGVLRWIANRNGFQLPGSTRHSDLATAQDGSADEVRTPVIRFGSKLILVGFRWSAGSGFFVFDLGEHNVRPLRTHLPMRGPVAAPQIPSERSRLVAVGRLKQDNHGYFQPTVVTVDRHGDILWTYQTSVEMHAIAADAAGKIFIAGSPSVTRWEQYHSAPLYNQKEECFVHGFNHDGEQLFTWYAPGPISAPLAIGANGELLVVSEGRLWAIG